MLFLTQHPKDNRFVVMIQLRPYQVDIIERARGEIRCGNKRILITAPTGSGKTALSAFIMKGAESRGLASWIIVHRRELVKQTVSTLGECGIFPDVVMRGLERSGSGLVSVCGVQTLSRRLSRMSEPYLIIWDECHHIAAQSWQTIFNKFPNSVHIGLTATPCRLDGTGLGSWFSKIIEGPSVKSLIEQGYLARYRLFAPNRPDLSGAKTRMGDWVRGDLESRIDRPAITGSAVEHYKSHCTGKRAVIFCVSVAHSMHVVEEFNRAGILAKHVDGETNDKERDKAIELFKQGRIRVLSNCELFGEGLDIPGIECAFLLRPTQSTGLYMQQVGRALRPVPGKDCAIIFDHVGNCYRHGLPDDSREWSLDGIGRTKRCKKSPDCVRVCSVCYAASPPRSPSCVYCGGSFSGAREVEEAAGNLSEVNKELLSKTRTYERKEAKSYDDLVQLGIRRGYKNPHGWAYFIQKGRKNGSGHHARSPVGSFQARLPSV